MDCLCSDQHSFFLSGASIEISNLPASRWQDLHRRYHSCESLLKELRVIVNFCVQTRGFATFQIEFHLFYPVWRDSEEAQEDQRHNGNGQSLRRCQDMSYIRNDDQRPRSFLYEAQMSFVIAGVDDHRWVSHCWTDTYFDQDCDEQETVQTYFDDSTSYTGLVTDPNSRGEHPADSPAQGPRIYFLRIFARRLNQAMTEWTNVVQRLQQALDTFERVSKDLVSYLLEYRSVPVSFAFAFHSVYLPAT